MGSLQRDVEDRLISGGWSLVRNSKHRVWRHPNGATFCTSTTRRDLGCDRERSFKEIAKKEEDPRYASRIPIVIIQEPSMPTAPTTPPAETIAPILTPAGGAKALTHEFKTYWGWMLAMRELRRIKRADLAAKMRPWRWSSSTVKALETGRMTLTEGELTLWRVIMQPSDQWGHIVIPTVPDDDPSAACRAPLPPAAPVVQPEEFTDAPAPSQPLDTLRAIREAQSRTQEHVAGVLGISTNYYNQMERGHRPFPEALVDRWEKDFGRPLPPSVVRSKATALRKTRATPAPKAPVAQETPVLQEILDMLNNPRLSKEEVDAYLGRVRAELQAALLTGKPLG